MKNLLLLLITINCQVSYSYQASIARYEPTSPSKDYPSNFSPAFSPSFTGHDTHSHSVFPIIHLISNSSCSYPNKYLPDLADFKSGPSSLRLKLRSSYGDDREYFYDKFGNLKNTEIFHKFKCYQYPGFLKLVKSIPEFEEFILHLKKTHELADGSPLYKMIHSSLDHPTANKIWRQLISMPNSVRNWQKIRKFDFRNEQLSNAGFDATGINLARSHGIDHEFIYSCDNVQQVQRSLITNHLNELAAFTNQENHITYLLKDITQQSETFAIAANTANRNHKQQQSSALIEVAKGFLSLAKGFADTCGRTGIAIADAIEHPINTFYEVNDAVCQISRGIAKVANTWGKFQAATDLMDLKMLNEANSEIRYACSCGRQVYEMIKHKYNTSSRAEILEMTGSLIANAVIAGYAMPQMQATAIQEIGTTIKLGKTAILSSCNLNKLGNISKKIKQSTGLLCKKGTDYFAKSANFTEEVEFVLASEIGNIKIPASNLLKHEAQITPSSKQIIDVARTAKIATFENQISKLVPKYSKQILHDAKQALRVSEYKILKKDNLAKEIEDLCVKIKKIVESKPHRKNFIYDAAHTEKATKGSIMEGLTACAAEDQGFFKELTRATDKRIDFIDRFKNKWDIKSPLSKTKETPFASFKKSKIIEDVIQEIKKKENIIIDITGLLELDSKELLNDLRKLKYTNKIIIIHRTNSKKSFIL